MEWTQLILDFITTFAHYIAWPAVALLVVFVFRKPLTELMGRLIEYESRHGTARFGLTSAPAQSASAGEMPAKLSEDANRNLTTLWEGQKYHFKDDYSRRWSFRMMPNSHVYGTFMMGFAELLGSGLVDWTSKDGQALLTDKGIEYIKAHPEIQTSNDRYIFSREP
jgi:hypothetical protein